AVYFVTTPSSPTMATDRSRRASYGTPLRCVWLFHKSNDSWLGFSKCSPTLVENKPMKGFCGLKLLLKGKDHTHSVCHNTSCDRENMERQPCVLLLINVRTSCSR